MKLTIILMVISAMLVIIAGMCKAFGDTIQFHFPFSKLSQLGDWWNPRESWKLKYSKAMTLTKKAWWYIGLHTPTYDEMFPFSTTILVALTDAWHFWGMIHNSTLLGSGIAFGAALPYLLNLSNLYLLLVIPLYMVFALTFHVFFHNILPNKK